MANLGFLGLGLMGYAMARNLARAGHQVAVWSYTSAKAKQLAEEEKAIACATPKEVAEKAEFVCICVGDTQMVEEVVLEPHGVIHGATPGTVVADASTIAPSASRAIGEKLASKGVHFLDAPCTGSTPGANAGTLTFMIGGDAKIFERTKPFFEIMGKKFYYCGGPGKGLQAKLTQNLILANLMQAFNEGMALSTKGGIDPALMLEILDNSAAKSGLIAYKAPFVFKRDFSTNFSTKWMHKDVGLAIESGEEMSLPLPITSLTQQMFRAAIAEGYGDLDMCATIRVMERWAGVEVKAK
ncbi:MAG TPA: NAD(P)-dependent oxidoreductase [Bryobacteraceae bacterium]|nr:NAD(P)-dependent oxidoreductase [Bryobacteraceae bacterium]